MKAIKKDTTYTYSSEWLNRLESELHWRYYWYQQKVIFGFLKPGDTILEIGIGSGFTAQYLRAKGFHVTTIDIDKDKKPDIVANIVEYKFESIYDHVIAFEVFEHIPFEDFIDVLKRLKPNIKKNLFFSIPRNEKVWLRCKMYTSLLKNIHFSITTRRNKIVSKHHHWELDYSVFNLDYLKSHIQKTGYTIADVSRYESLWYLTLLPVIN